MIFSKKYQARLYPLRYHPIQQKLIDDTYSIKKRFCVVPAGRRCLAEGTMVATPTGPVAIEDLNVGDKIIGYNKKGKLEFTRVKEVFDNGIQEVTEFLNFNQQYFCATLNHHFLGCGENYLNRNDATAFFPHSPFQIMSFGGLTKRHRVKKMYAESMISGGSLPVNYTYSLGAFLGDGNSTIKDDETGVRKKTLYISSENHIIPFAIADEINGIAFKLPSENYTWKIKCKDSIVDIIPFYREWVFGKKAHEKIADWDEIDKWNRKSCMAFLAGLIDTDGSIFYKNNRKAEIVVNIGMQAKLVIECCQKIIFKYFQEKLSIHEDMRDKYINGSCFSIKTSSNDLAIRVIKEVNPYLKAKKDFDLSTINVRNKPTDRIGGKHGESFLAQTFDLHVTNDTNLYSLHHGGIITHNSGKTEILGKRRLVARAMVGVDAPSPRYFAAAPVRDQAKRMYWNDLKTMCEPFMAKEPSESNLVIYLNGDREIHIIGMDKPERIEGSHWDGGVLDEYGNMKEKAWKEHVRPALSTPGRPPAWCDFIGVPEGRNHYYDLYEAALKDEYDTNGEGVWGVYTWPSEDILDPEEIIQAKKDLDELTYAQEYLGNFITFQGLVYYNFDRNVHCKKLDYNEHGPLLLGFDFNVEPGVCSIMQEFDYQNRIVDGIIDEVYIPRNSNTEIVCNKVLEKYHNHKGDVLLYGDATGGGRSTSQAYGKTDWIIIQDILRPVFGNRLSNRVTRSNPAERDRINSVNSRLKNTLGQINLFVDFGKCPNTVKDLEGVTVLPGSAGAIDKHKNLKLSHISDSFGYAIFSRHPIVGGNVGPQNLGGF